MSREILLHHAEVRNYCSIWMDTLRGGATQLVNTNKLLKSYSGITGLKTSTTGKGGRLHLRQCRARRPAADCRCAGVCLGQGAFPGCQRAVGLRLCPLWRALLLGCPPMRRRRCPSPRPAETVTLTYTAPNRCPDA